MAADTNNLVEEQPFMTATLLLNPLSEVAPPPDGPADPETVLGQMLADASDETERERAAAQQPQTTAAPRRLFAYD